MGMSFKVVTINHSYLTSRANTSVHLQLWNPTTADQSPVLQILDWTRMSFPRNIDETNLREQSIFQHIVVVTY